MKKLSGSSIAAVISTVLAIILFSVIFLWTRSQPQADGSSYALGSNQAGWISCTQATPCASSATTFFVAPITTLYRISAGVACTSTTAAATVILAIKYTDPSSTVQTITLATATCTALGIGSIASLDQPEVMAAGTNVQYSVTIVNAPSYQARIAVYQEGMN
jgi:hypothetical protein